MADKYLNLVGTQRVIEKLKAYADEKEGLGAGVESEVLILNSEIDPDTGGGGGSYVLPTATASTLGGVKIGSGITITDGVISAITSAAVQSMIDTSLAAITNADEVSF